MPIAHDDTYVKGGETGARQLPDLPRPGPLRTLRRACRFVPASRSTWSPIITGTARH